MNILNLNISPRNSCCFIYPHFWQISDYSLIAIARITSPLCGSHPFTSPRALRNVKFRYIGNIHSPIASYGKTFSKLTLRTIFLLRKPRKFSTGPLSSLAALVWRNGHIRHDPICLVSEPRLSLQLPSAARAAYPDGRAANNTASFSRNDSWG